MALSGTIRRLSVVVSAEDRASRKLRDVNREADDASDSLGGAEVSAQALRRSFMALAGTTAALGTAMAAMTRLGGRIDSTLATIQVTSGATASEMQAIQSEISNIGATMPVTLGQVSEAFRELSYAGFDAAESIEAVGTVTDLAVAGQMSIGQSARIVTSNLRAFNMEAEQSGAVASSMAATFANSALTIDEMGKSLEYVAPVASQAGQSIIEVNAALGTLADNGVRASRAGTGLQQFFSNIVRPSGRAEDALEQMGLATEDFLDQEGDFKDMNEMLALLSDELDDMPEGERLQVLIDLFGQRGARAIAPLIENVDEFNEKVGEAAAADLASAIAEFEEMGAEEVAQIDDAVMLDLDEDTTQEQILNQLIDLSDDLSSEELAAQIRVAFDVDERSAEILAEDIEGGASAEELARGLEAATTEGELAEAQLETVSGQIDYMKGSISSLAYEIYAGFRPALQFMFDRLIAVLDLLNEHPKAMKLVGGALFGLTAAFATATLVVGAFYAKTVLLPAVLSTMTTGLWGATAGVYGFLTALGPLGWALIAISGLITAYATNLFGFRDAVNTVLSPLGYLIGGVEALGSAALWTGRALAYMAKFGLKVLLAPVYALGAAVLWAVDAVQSFIGWFGDLPLLGKLVVGALMPPVAILWGLGEAIEWAGEKWQGLKERLGGGLPDIVGGLWSDLGEHIGDQLRPFIVIGQGIYAIVQQIDDAFASIGDTVSWVGDLIHDMFLLIQEQISDIPLLGSLFETDKEMQTDVFGGPSVEEGGMQAGGQESGSGLVTGMATGVQQDQGMLQSAVGSAVESAAQYLPGSEAEQGPLSNLYDRGSGLVNALSGGVEQSQPTFSESIRRIATHAMDAFGGSVGDGLTAEVTGETETGLGQQSVVQGVTDDMTSMPGIGGPPQGGGEGGGASINLDINIQNEFGNVSDPEAVGQQVESSTTDAVDRAIRRLEDEFSMALR